MSPDELLIAAVRAAEEIEARGIDFLKKTPAIFDKTSHRIPHLRNPELGFIRVSSWLYVLFFETGKIGVRFLEEQFDGYQIDHNCHLAKHTVLIHALRTFSQHNLNLTTTSDMEVLETCNEWFRSACGTSTPTQDEEWFECLKRLLQEATEYLNGLARCLRCIEKDESRNEIQKKWLFRKDHYHPPHEFDALISITAADIGRNFLDIVPFRKRNYDRWVQQLNLFQNYDFQVEARKLIEDSIIKDLPSIIPVTGKDIIQHLNIPPGPEIGNLLTIARKKYQDNPYYTKEQLLNTLRDISDRNE